MKKIFREVSVVLLIALLVLPSMTVFAEEVAEEESGIVGDLYVCSYTHDPRINVKAMADIVVNPDAVYGFSPDPKSTRLGEYANMIDWSDPVAVDKARQERINYLSQFDKMYSKWDEMKKTNKDTETIARTISAMRNQIRLDSYKNDPEGLAVVKRSNLETYGNEDGPTADSLYEKYGSWDKVLIKSFSSNSGMDACVGLYEAQYNHNIMAGTIVEQEEGTYVVNTGDTLSKIAKRYYGNSNAWTNIYNSNKDLLNDPNVLIIGEELTIPLK